MARHAEHQNLQKVHNVPVEQQQMNNRRSPKGASPLRGVFQGPGCNKRSQKLKKSKNTRHGSISRPQKRSPSSDSSSSGEASGSETSGRDSPAPQSPLAEVMPVITEGGGGCRGWHSRRRDARMNGADIYVARITKNGLGNAKPCWRCLEWCKWAGIKRIFHWNEETKQFDVVKVNNAQLDQYETHADIRLFAGLVSFISFMVRKTITDDDTYCRAGNYYFCCHCCCAPTFPPFCTFLCTASVSCWPLFVSIIRFYISIFNV